jgi:hypothetical protein
MLNDPEISRAGHNMPEGSYPIFELDESPSVPSRFDAPLQLENRGTTSQEVTPQIVLNGRLHQQLLWAKCTIHKNTVAAKLRAYGRSEPAATLERCHTVFTVAQCSGCQAVQKFPNRCDLFFCPECQPRLAADRKKAVGWWTQRIEQPKHMVLTVKNVPDLTKAHVLEFKKWFSNLRRTAFARNWLGGFYSLEVTNEGKGWHLHLHALINARYIDKFLLSEKWSKVTNGMGRIVEVRDARQKNYLAEVTKYAVKGVQLAAWTGQEIATFIDAFTGVRTFGVFGDLYGMRTRFAEWFKMVRDQKPLCKCGCSQMHYFTEAQFLEKDFVAVGNAETIPPPKAPDLNLQFSFAEPPQFGPR